MAGPDGEGQDVGLDSEGPGGQTHCLAGKEPGYGDTRLSGVAASLEGVRQGPRI